MLHPLTLTYQILKQGAVVTWSHQSAGSFVVSGLSRRTLVWGAISTSISNFNGIISIPKVMSLSAFQSGTQMSKLRGRQWTSQSFRVTSVMRSNYLCGLGRLVHWITDQTGFFSIARSFGKKNNQTQKKTKQKQAQTKQKQPKLDKKVMINITDMLIFLMWGSLQGYSLVSHQPNLQDLLFNNCYLMVWYSSKEIVSS